MSVIEITSASHFTELTTSLAPTTLVALYFHTSWAAPCAQMTSVFKTLSSIHSSSLFLSVNADDFPDISESFDVSAVPYFVLLRDNTILKELSGADPKELANAIQSLVSTGSSTPTASSSSNSAVNGNGSNYPEKPTSDSSNGGIAPPEEESEEELKARLTKLVSAAPVMLFMKGTPASPSCGFSRQLVSILREHQVRFGFFDILKDNSIRQGLKVYSDWPTFPQLYINGELQGGLDIVKESIQEDPEFFTKAVGTAV